MHSASAVSCPHCLKSKCALYLHTFMRLVADAKADLKKKKIEMGVFSAQVAPKFQ